MFFFVPLFSAWAKDTCVHDPRNDAQVHADRESLGLPEMEAITCLGALGSDVPQPPGKRRGGCLLSWLGCSSLIIEPNNAVRETETPTGGHDFGPLETVHPFMALLLE